MSSLTGRCPERHPGTGPAGLPFPPFSLLLRNKKSPHLPARMRSSGGRLRPHEPGFPPPGPGTALGVTRPATSPLPPIPTAGLGDAGLRGPLVLGWGRAGGRCSGRAGAVRAESARRYEPRPVCRWGRGAFPPHRRRSLLQSAGGRREKSCWALPADADGRARPRVPGERLRRIHSPQVRVGSASGCAVPGRAMPCHAVPGRAMPCQAVPCCARPCHARPYEAMPCRARPC